jgi:hypothetical protein
MKMKVVFNKIQNAGKTMRVSTMISLLMATLAGCGDKSTDSGSAAADTGLQGEVDPDRYAFAHPNTGASSVSYSGQVFRQLLVDDMSGHLGGLTERIDNGWFPVPGELESELVFYFEFDSDTAGALAHDKAVNGTALQGTYDEVASGKDLVGKIAGNDEGGQHVDWTTDFVGWGSPGDTTPEGLVRLWFSTVDAQAIDWSNGTYPLDPSGDPVSSVTITAEGQDLTQLIDNFTRGAIAFSQATDDYLDDDIADKGLNAAHDGWVDGAPYTELEHSWDEGFGYFGASRDYPAWTDDDIADVGSVDGDGDGFVDLLSEVNWGHSVNCAKRDRGAVAATDFTDAAWTGFHGGRALLHRTAGTSLSDEEMGSLEGYRDQAVAAWEQAIAATVVHYINNTLQDTAAIGTADYDFSAHAKHWSEGKGFALLFQFNPRSPMTDSDFATLHTLLRDAPALEGDNLDAYTADLLTARALIGSTYGFDGANLGDEYGDNGW